MNSKHVFRLLGRLAFKVMDLIHYADLWIRIKHLGTYDPFKVAMYLDALMHCNEIALGFPITFLLGWSAICIL